MQKCPPVQKCPCGKVSPRAKVSHRAKVSPCKSVPVQFCPPPVIYFIHRKNMKLIELPLNLWLLHSHWLLLLAPSNLTGLLHGLWLWALQLGSLHVSLVVLALVNNSFVTQCSFWSWFERYGGFDELVWLLDQGLEVLVCDFYYVLSTGWGGDLVGYSFFRLLIFRRYDLILFLSTGWGDN